MACGARSGLKQQDEAGNLPGATLSEWPVEPVRD